MRKPTEALRAFLYALQWGPPSGDTWRKHVPEDWKKAALAPAVPYSSYQVTRCTYSNKTRKYTVGLRLKVPPGRLVEGTIELLRDENGEPKVLPNTWQMQKNGD